MKNIFLLMLAVALVACSANQPAPTPTETLTPAAPTKTPVPPSPSAAPEIVVDVETRGEAYSDVLIANIAAGKYDEQIQGIKNWWSYWRENQFVTEANIHVTFLEDQNNDPDSVYAYLMTPDGMQYVFPPLALVKNKIPVPAYQNTNFDLEPLKIHKTITLAEVPEMLKLGYSQEMADFLVGTDFAIRGRQFTRVRNGEVVAFIGPEGKWVKELDMKMCPSKVEAKNCPITDEQYNNNVFLYYAMRHDASGLFDMNKVIFWPLVKRMKGVIYYMDWASSEAVPDPRVLFDDPTTRISKRAGWGFIFTDETNGYGFYAKVVKFTRRNGEIVWMSFKDGDSLSDEGNSDFPVFSVDGYPDRVSISDQELMLTWIDSGEVPNGLNGARLLVP